MFRVSIVAFACGALPARAATVYAHYSFDSDFADSSGNNRHGTLTDVGTIGNSGITTTTGQHVFGGGAMNFSSDADYIAIPSKTFDSPAFYTIAFWAKRADATRSWDMVAGQRGNNNFFIALGSSPTQVVGLRWRSSSTATERQADFAVGADTAWHHYAVVASGTTITLYYDGELFATATDKLTGFIIDTIGQAYNNTSFPFNGCIDELWVFDEALSAAAVAGLYHSNDPDASTEYAGFHHRYDGDFTDSGLAANHGIPAGGAAITTDADAVAAGSGALALDGASGGFVTLATPLDFTASQPWSVTWWARRGETGANRGMVIGNAGNNTDFIWHNDNYNGLRFRSSTGTTLDFTTPKDTLLRHHALVADGEGGLSLFLDGQFAQSLSGDTSFSITTIGNAYSSSVYNFQGSLDEIRVVPEALSAAQVAAIYDQEKPAQPPVSDTERLLVLMLAGQSNADGRAAVFELPPDLQSPQNDVDFYYMVEGQSPVLTTLRPGLSETSQFGPEIRLGRRYADIYAGEEGTRVAIIKYANGGTNLHTQWKPGGDATTNGDGPEYVVFQNTATSGLAALAAAHPNATIELVAFVWMQGESDADNDAGANAYQANLAAFISDVRATYGASLPFLISRLSAGQTAINATRLATVCAAQDAVAAADPLTGILDTDSFGMKSDNLHFDGAGQMAMGSGFAAEAAYYTWMLETFCPADIAAGRAEPDADPDGDSRTNRDEFMGGSNPLSATSFFRAWCSPSATDGMQLSYATTTRHLYEVQHYSEPSETWSTVLPQLRGTGQVVVRPLPDLGDRAILRVRSMLP